MYTYDEWGNTVWHIQTGREGLKFLEEAGFENTMTPEEYDRHMKSWRKLYNERQEGIIKQLMEFFKGL